MAMADLQSERKKVALLLIPFLSALSPIRGEGAEIPGNFKRENLIAWCIVPFDAKQRDPEERAAMVRRLGLKRVAYDWREMHIPEFETEALAYQNHGIELFAFWRGHDDTYALFEKHRIKPQIWKTLQTGDGLSNKEKAESAAEALVPLADQLKKAGLTLGLYNHGGWGGLPDNMVAVCKRLHEMGFENVGLVYNFHHAHPRISSFPSDLKKMLPYLLCVNLNGMADPSESDLSKSENRIKAIGAGKHEREMIATVIREGYDGPVGILGHVATRDVEEVLRENLEGLEELLAGLP